MEKKQNKGASARSVDAQPEKDALVMGLILTKKFEIADAMICRRFGLRAATLSEIRHGINISRNRDKYYYALISVLNEKLQRKIGLCEYIRTKLAIADIAVVYIGLERW